MPNNNWADALSMLGWLEYQTREETIRQKKIHSGFRSHGKEVDIPIGDILLGALPWVPPQGLSQAIEHLLPGQAAASAPATQGTEDTPASSTAATPATNTINPKKTPVPLPFGKEFNYVSGNDFGQPVDVNSISGGYGPIHMGIDYGTPEGTPILASFGGTVQVDLGNSLPGYGNRVILKMDDGESIVFGHIGGSNLKTGDRVNPGDQIAISGANVGVSQGAVTLVEYHGKNGEYLNPHMIFDRIFDGATFEDLGKDAIKAQRAAPYFTPDGTMITPNTQLDRYYNMVNGFWKSTYGENAPGWAANMLMKTGVQNVEQVKGIMDNMPSDISGLTMGARRTLKANVENLTQKLFGRTAPDSMLRQFHAQGLTNPVAIEEWFHSHPASDMPQADFQGVYDELLKHTAAYNTQPHWDDIHAAWLASGGGGATGKTLAGQNPAPAVGEGDRPKASRGAIPL